MKKFGLWVLAVGISTFSTAAVAQGPDAPSDHGLEIGFRLGFAIPAGNAGDLTDEMSGMIPLVVDAGYHLKQNFYLGLSFQYAFGLFSTDYCSESGASCSASDSRLDLNLHYRLSPGQECDPWVGIGIGYEWLTLNDVVSSESGHRTASGFEFANLQIGGDFQVAPTVGIGPFLSISFGQYQALSVKGSGYLSDMTVTSSEIHQWITIGVRGIYDVSAHLARPASSLQ
jgi:opacity protein-like surface antigen